MPLILANNCQGTWYCCAIDSSVSPTRTWYGGPSHGIAGVNHRASQLAQQINQPWLILCRYDRLTVPPRQLTQCFDQLALIQQCHRGAAGGFVIMSGLSVRCRASHVLTRHGLSRHRLIRHVLIRYGLVLRAEFIAPEYRPPKSACAAAAPAGTSRQTNLPLLIHVSGALNSAIPNLVRQNFPHPRR